MAPIGSKKEKSKEHEEYVAKLIGGRRSRSSGANVADNTDVVSAEWAIECEYTDNKSYSFKRSNWDEIRYKAVLGRLPAWAVRFYDTEKKQHLDLVVLSIHDFVALIEGEHE